MIWYRWMFEMCETVSHVGLDVISHLSNTHIYQITPLERCETKSNLDKIEPDTVIVYFNISRLICLTTHDALNAH